MISIAVIILGFAALGGSTLAAIRLSGTPRPPTWLAVGHGAIATTGLTLLILAVSNGGVDRLINIALGVIVLAALGGTTIFVGFHLRNRALPIPLVIGHALIAITGYVLLLVGMSHG